PKLHSVAHPIINPLKHDIPLQPRWKRDLRKLWCCSGLIERNIFSLEEISPPKDVETSVESSILVSPSSSVGSSSPVRSIKPPLDNLSDESVYAKLDILL
nr:hypothetical protein [Tanacetum cinerariifolium]